MPAKRCGCVARARRWRPAAHRAALGRRAPAHLERIEALDLVRGSLAALLEAAKEHEPRCAARADAAEGRRDAAGHAHSLAVLEPVPFHGRIVSGAAVAVLVVRAVPVGRRCDTRADELAFVVVLKAERAKLSIEAPPLRVAVLSLRAGDRPLLRGAHWLLIRLVLWHHASPEKLLSRRSGELG